MLRSAARLVACALCVWLASGARSAQAHDMDLALSRLRLAQPWCGDDGRGLDVEAYCGDQELFERLVSELAVAMAPPAAGPARTVGPRGLKLSLSTTLTGVHAGELYWRRGTEGSLPARQISGDPNGASIGDNPDPSPVLFWNRLEARKGLPFGFEAGAALGQGIDTSLWTLGLSLKWALFEGFRTQLGRLPDVAVQGGYSRSVGSSQATIH